MRMILVNTYNEIAGIHFWQNAPSKLDYLRHPHRHNFIIHADFLVTDADREIEIFTRQREIELFLRSNFRFDGELIYFEGNSCEHIAKMILTQFQDCVEVEVLEDGRGGAVVRK